MHILKKIKESKKHISPIVRDRIKQFKAKKNANNEELFSELCFCILTANFNAERSIKIQNAIGGGFLTLSKKELAKKLKQLGHRFPNARAEYIVKARKHIQILKKIALMDSNEARDWLVKNVKGIGMKEASHFLRNIGHENVAIIDFHILDILENAKLIKRPKSLTAIKYIEIENKLKGIAEKTHLNLAELDLFLWSIETGKVLK